MTLTKALSQTDLDSLAAAVVRVTDGDRRTRAEVAETKRAEILSRFPLDRWPELPLENYALGLENNENSFCWWLEFGSKELGLISGGTASKLLIYKRQNAPGWYFPDIYPNEQVAWQEIRAMFVRLFDAARRGNWQAVDEMDPDMPRAPVLTRKALHIYFPNDVLAVYGINHLIHYAQLLGIENIKQLAGTRVGLNRAVLAAARQIDVLAPLTSSQIGIALTVWSPVETKKRIMNPSAEDEADIDESAIDAPLEDIAPRYLHISAGEKGRLWEEWQREGVATIGWNDLGNLTSITDDAAFETTRTAAQARNPDWGTGGPRMVWKFRNLRVGDWLIARRGSDMLLGVGQVSGPYFYDPTYEHAHRIPVQWLDTSSQQVDYNFGVSSLGEIDVDRFQALTGRTVIYPSHIERGTSVAEPAADALIMIDSGGASIKTTGSGHDEIKPLVPAINTIASSRQSTPDIQETDLLAHVKAHIRARGYYFTDETIANYHISLKTRPFVILAGLSGTGKSKLTQLYAEALGCIADEAYLRLAVQPNWTDVRFLLGYMNGINNK